MYFKNKYFKLSALAVLSISFFLIFNFSTNNQDALALTKVDKYKIEVFKTPSCGCCYGYVLFLEEENYNDISKRTPVVCEDLVDVVSTQDNQMISIVMGSTLNALPLLKHEFEGSTVQEKFTKDNLINTALLYLNTPYLWGGKTPFGIDCSGFTQMVYKLNGYRLKRDASQQVEQGEALSFIEASEPGDLAFFDNTEGDIIHVGIIMKDNYILHSHGKVRIDRLDHTGIFNIQTRLHTHKLRVIKRIV